MFPENFDDHGVGDMKARIQHLEERVNRQAKTIEYYENTVCIDTNYGYLWVKDGEPLKPIDTKKLGDLFKENKYLKVACERYFDEKEKLTIKLRDSEARIEDLQYDVDHLLESSILKENEILKSENEGLNKRIQNQAKHTSELQEDLNHITGRASELARNKEVLQKEYNILQKDYSDLQKEHDDVCEDDKFHGTRVCDIQWYTFSSWVSEVRGCVLNDNTLSIAKKFKILNSKFWPALTNTANEKVHHEDLILDKSNITSHAIYREQTIATLREQLAESIAQNVAHTHTMAHLTEIIKWGKWV